MPPEPSQAARSRRALLAAGLGAGAATVASALVRPLPAEAVGVAITVGDTVTGSARTTLDISAAQNAATAFWAISDGGPALAGSSATERGVAGASDSAAGVQGNSNTGPGTAGVSATGPGVRGLSTGGAGVAGYALPPGLALMPTPVERTGVYGYSDVSASAVGVFGQSGPGTGVRASSISGTGLYATSSSGYAVGGVSGTGTGVRGDSSTAAGVEGLSETGSGVYGGSASSSGIFGYSGTGAPPAEPSNTGVFGFADHDATAVGVHGRATAGTGVRATATTGTALAVSGKAVFSRSGRAKVLAHKAYVDVTVPGGVASTALCFANLTVYRSGVAVAAVRPAYPAAGKLRIYLTKALTTATYVSWIVMG
jgi:hypothetical protein